MSQRIQTWQILWAFFGFVDRMGILRVVVVYFETSECFIINRTTLLMATNGYLDRESEVAFRSRSITLSFH